MLTVAKIMPTLKFKNVWANKSWGCFSSSSQRLPFLVISQTWTTEYLNDYSAIIFFLVGPRHCGWLLGARNFDLWDAHWQSSFQFFWRNEDLQNGAAWHRRNRMAGEYKKVSLPETKFFSGREKRRCGLGWSCLYNVQALHGKRSTQTIQK